MTTRMQKVWKGFWQFIAYSLVGLATAFVAYGTRLAILNVYAQIYGLDLESTDLAMVGGSSVLRTIAQTIGWIAGLIFSFMPYKFIVFRNKEWGWKPLGRQFLTFFISRILSYFLELLLAVGLPIGLQAAGYKTFMLFGANGIPMTADNQTIVISVFLVTAINFPIGKLLVFKKKKQKS
ncbi:MAG: hypothetical protein E7680_04470 [Ruminococcaceae bacterium]|nr:hypothetical protein [Oscillospiraceae bacterium]